jgi:hypothetical protein
VDQERRDLLVDGSRRFQPSSQLSSFAQMMSGAEYRDALLPDDL